MNNSKHVFRYWMMPVLVVGAATQLAACVDPGYAPGYGYGAPYGYGPPPAKAYGPPPPPPSTHVTYVDVPVVSATPVYREVRVAQPRQACANAPVDNSANSVVGTVLGGVVGGVVGHQIGEGSGNAIATAAGAVAGAVAGNSIANQGAPGYQTQCQTVNDYSTQQQPDGYDVAYRYNDEVLHTHTSYEPGTTIRVKVAVTPGA